MVMGVPSWSKHFNEAESACLQCMSWALESKLDWRNSTCQPFNSTCQPFLTSNWHFWQMAQMSDKCLSCKTEKAQISGQMQIICVGWGLWDPVPIIGTLFGTVNVCSWSSSMSSIEDLYASTACRTTSWGQKDIFTMPCFQTGTLFTFYFVR